MKKVLALAIISIFSLNQFAFSYSPEKTVNVSNIVKSMYAKQVVSQLNSLSDSEKESIEQNTMNDLNEAINTLDSISDEQFKAVMTGNIERIKSDYEGSVTDDMISKLSDSDINEVTPMIDEETLTLSSDARSAVSYEVKKETEAKKIKAVNDLSGVTRADFLAEVKNMKEKGKTKGALLTSIFSSIISALVPGLAGSVYGSVAAGAAGTASAIVSGFVMSNIVTISIVLAIIGAMFIAGLIMWICGMVKKQAVLSGFGGYMFGFGLAGSAIGFTALALILI